MLKREYEKGASKERNRGIKDDIFDYTPELAEGTHKDILSTNPLNRTNEIARIEKFMNDYSNDGIHVDNLRATNTKQRVLCRGEDLFKKFDKKTWEILKGYLTDYEWWHFIEINKLFKYIIPQAFEFLCSIQGVFPDDSLIWKLINEEISRKAYLVHKVFVKRFPTREHTFFNSTLFCQNKSKSTSVDYSDALIDAVRLSADEYEKFQFQRNVKEGDQPYVFLSYLKSQKSLLLWKSRAVAGETQPRIQNLLTLYTGDLIPDPAKTKFLSPRLFCVGFHGKVFRIYDWFSALEYQNLFNGDNQAYEEHLAEFEFQDDGMLRVSAFSDSKKYFQKFKVSSLPLNSNWLAKLVSKDIIVCLETTTNYLLQIELAPQFVIRGSQVLSKDAQKFEIKDFEIVPGEKPEIYIVDTLGNIFQASLDYSEILSLTAHIKTDQLSPIRGVFFNWKSSADEKIASRLAYMMFIQNSFWLVDLKEAKVHNINASLLPKDITPKAFDWIIIDNYLIYFYQNQIIFRSLTLDENWDVESVVDLDLNIVRTDFVSLQNYNGSLLIFAFENNRVVIKLYPTFTFAFEEGQKFELSRKKREKKNQVSSFEHLRFIKTFLFEARKLELNPKDYSNGEARAARSLFLLRYLNSLLLVDLNNVSVYPTKAYNYRKNTEELATEFTESKTKLQLTPFNYDYLKFNSEDNRNKPEEAKLDPIPETTQKVLTKTAIKKELKGLPKEEKASAQKKAKEKGDDSEEERSSESDEGDKGRTLEGPQKKQPKAEKVRERKEKEKKNEKTLKSYNRKDQF